MNASGQFGWTALHAAAYQGLNDIVEFLVQKGAKPDTADLLLKLGATQQRPPQ